MCLELQKKTNGEPTLISWWLVSQIENKNAGSCLETVLDIQRESQAVLDIIKENNFRRAFEAQKKL